jgi:glycosyltransferase involved in cell wall biosynthesis
MDPTLRRASRLVYGGVEAVLARRPCRIIAVSAAEWRHARRLGVPARRLHLVVNGAQARDDVSRAQARAEMGLDDEAVAVGFVGRLVPQKNPLLFVEAVIEARRRAPQLVGVAIGDGPLRDAAETRAKDGGVIFLGWRDGAALMNGLDIFCMTSAYEAMPYTLLEAVHAGLPIVTTPVGGVEETVLDGQTGVVAPAQARPQDIAQALVALAEDPGLRRRWSEGARALAVNRTVRRMVEETVAVYREAVRDAAGGRRLGGATAALDSERV